MKTILVAVLLITVIGISAIPVTAQSAVTDTTPRNLRPTPFAEWSRGPAASPDFFPISVWMQDPRDAKKYKAAGINMYKNLWAGPTAEQLAGLRAAGMPVICEQNEYALQHLDDPIIVGWIQLDEPDNAQKIGVWTSVEAIRQAWPNLPARELNKTLEEWGPYGPPLSPKHIQNEYGRMKRNDPTRPIWLHLGQSVAWDGYKGRGVRTGMGDEDYPEYVKGADVTNFDIYPSVHSKPEIRGKLEWVPRGVDRLRSWTKDRQIVSVAIECTRMGGGNKPKPHHVKAEIWMSITHGARAICYFVHEFAPKFNANALLDDPAMLATVTNINQQIHSLAPVINSPSVEGLVTVASSNAAVPISTMVKRFAGDTYIFAVAMRPQTTEATFTIKGLANQTTADLLGEGRTLPIADGAFTDSFTDYAVHLYKIPGPQRVPAASGGK